MNMPETCRPWFAVACGLLAFDAAAAAGDGASAATAPGEPQMDCELLASMPNPPMSLQSCLQLAGAAQAQTAAAKEPAAARPGDAAMTCADIAAEMRTMPGVGLAQAQQDENSAAVAGYQSKIAEQRAELARTGMATTAAAAAGLLTQIATGGLFTGGAAQAAQQAALAHGMARGQEMAQERRPAEQRMTRAAGDSVQAMGQSTQDHPRFARLVQPAMDKQCRE